MNELDKKYDNLDLGVAMQVSEAALESGNAILEIIADLDKRLTNTNFLTNGGGAVAILTFMGEHPAPFFVKIALTLFTLGVIATGIELRALLVHFGELHKANSQRNRDFRDNKISARELANIPENVGRISKWVNHGAGWFSQLLFFLGVAFGAYGFLYCNT